MSEILLVCVCCLCRMSRAQRRQSNTKPQIRARHAIRDGGQLLLLITVHVRDFDTHSQSVVVLSRSLQRHRITAYHIPAHSQSPFMYTITHTYQCANSSLLRYRTDDDIASCRVCAVAEGEHRIRITPYCWHAAPDY